MFKRAPSAAALAALAVAGLAACGGSQAEAEKTETTVASTTPPTTAAPETTAAPTTTTPPTTAAPTTTEPQMEAFPYPDELNGGAPCPSERYMGTLNVADFKDPSSVEQVAVVCLDMKWNVIAPPPARDTAVAVLGCADEMPEALNESIEKRPVTTPHCDQAVNMLRLEDGQARFRLAQAVRYADGLGVFRRV